MRFLARHNDVFDELSHEHLETIHGTRTTANTARHIKREKMASTAHKTFCAGINHCVALCVFVASVLSQDVHNKAVSHVPFNCCAVANFKITYITTYKHFACKLSFCCDSFT